ncbi:SdiA-regulated domain-containing protein [Reichenbachiella carrageenanivorans]|uniref:SdiA-regulated domain-containing protein n=1 Tax=Reichenbachiella carrageenanivorans TaxID=2979869 RepID=A0ABY6D6Y4_9BACT|nr:SdiA-regulated domain-containing protein [Reichenbachiella carrageenanivorans]UXX79595.1 SdiA-regulated domain-containing protein [Reichenbachiella carrageenanivorans]
MRTLTLSLAILLSCRWFAASQDTSAYQELSFISIHQMAPMDSLNFDFSGIVSKGDSIFIVADKPWNTFLYSITFSEKKWIAHPYRQISSTEKLDLEAVDHCNGFFYLANEFRGSIYRLPTSTAEVQTLPINFKENNLAPSTWKNAGWEGLTIDCENQVMYLVKERQPRNIVVVDMNRWGILDQFDIPQTESNDFSDAKYLNGHLYLLERNGNYITKVNTKTKTVVEKYHYRHIASHPNGKLYAPEKYGMAEALLLTDNEIWIGLDNNGLEVTDHAKDTYQLTGHTPVIIKFKRPAGF